VKAGEGAVEAASIVAPAIAAIAPRDKMRKTMVFLQVCEDAPRLYCLHLNLA
jgi:hypothetical protein